MLPFAFSNADRRSNNRQDGNATANGTAGPAAAAGAAGGAKNASAGNATNASAAVTLKGDPIGQMAVLPSSGFTLCAAAQLRKVSRARAHTRTEIHTHTHTQAQTRTHAYIRTAARDLLG